MATKKPLPAYLRSSEDLNYDALDQFLGTLNQAQPEPELGSRGALRGMGDVALSAGRGAVQGVRMLSDLGGSDNAVSKGLRSVEDYIGSLRSAQAQQDDQQVAAILKSAEGAGILDQVVAGAKAFAVAPVSTLAQAVGTSIPTLAAAAIPGVGPAAVAGRMGAALSIGAGQGAGSVKGQIYDTVKDELRQAGASPEEAERRALEASSYEQSGGKIATGAALGALAGTTGAERAVGAMLRGSPGAAQGMARRVVQGAVTEGIPEALQGGQEKLAGNQALYEQGFERDPMSGVVAAGTMEALAGAGMGAIAGLPSPAQRPGDQLRAEGLQPEIGPFTRSSNKVVEAAANVLDNATTALGATPPKPLVGNEIDYTPEPITGNLAIGDAQEIARQNIAKFAARHEPIAQADAQAMVARAEAEGKPMVAVPHPEGGGFTVVPRQWVTAAMANPSPQAGPPPQVQAAINAADDLQLEGEAPRMAKAARTPEQALQSIEAQGTVNRFGKPVLDDWSRLADAPQAGSEPEWIEQARAVAEADQRAARAAAVAAAPVDRAPRTPRAQPAPDAAPQADLVATYVDQRRNDGTPAGRAFAQDFDAGRITRADVQGLIDTARPQSADDRLAAAAAQAPKPQALQPGDILNPRGEPFRNQRAATTTAQREGGSVIVVDGGWAVRKATDAPATAAAAGPRDADTGRSTGTGVLRDQQPADLPVSAERPADQGAEQPAAAVVRAGSAAEPATALSPDADLPTLKKAWSEAAAAGDTERAREINDRIVAKKGKKVDTSAQPVQETPKSEQVAPAAEAAPKVESDSNPVTSGNTGGASSTDQAPVKQPAVKGSKKAAEIKAKRAAKLNPAPAAPASQPEPELVAPAAVAQSNAEPEATHKDPGEPAEPVTPAVVEEAIKTAARNEERPRSEMKAEAPPAEPEAAPSAAPVQQAEPEKAVEPAARLTDAGEELIRNRRGKLKGLAWGDVSAMNDTLKVAQVIKANVWPRPDYAKMVEDGAPAWKAAALKAVYDKLAAAPVTRAAPTDADLKDYIETMHLVRDALLAELDRVAALPDGKELWKTLQARNVFGKVFPVPADARPVYGAPSAFDRSSEQGKTNNRRALLIGGNAAVHALQFGYKMTSKVKDLVADGFPAKQEAWQKSYEVRQTETRDNDVPEAERTGQPQQRFYVYEKGSRYRLAKGGQDGGYGTQEQAEAFARSLTTKKREVLPPSRGLDLAEAKRTGPDWRNGKDVNAQDIMDRFGFRGVNLGEYVKAKQGMAQLHLNHVFDAFSDLADLLGVPPKAMSLNGTLGVAIGAQGSGKALAHFVPGVNEINITRDSGAGALAHEFGHAVDHYFATQHGRAVSMAKRPYLSAVVEGSTDSGDVRPEVMDAMRAVMKTLNARPMTEAEARKFLAEQRELNQRRMDRWVKEFSGNKGADPAALAAVAEKLKRGDLGAPQDADVEANLSEFMRAAGLKPGNAIAANAFSLAYRLRDLADETRFLARHIPQVDTDYAKASAAMDAKKTGDGYWSTPWEKFARAFETFAMDALKDRQRESLYLSGLVDSEGWRSWASETGKAIPYPAGDERLAMQQAFQKLVDTIDTRADDAGNVAMYSRGKGRGISTRDAKAVVATIRSALPNAPDIVLHETVEQAPEGLQDKIREEGAEDDVEAVYWNGEIHAFPKHMESVERALFVIGRHEVRHHGLRVRFGTDTKKMDEVLMAMWRGNQALRQATQAIIDGGRARPSERVLAIEEALADLPVAEIAKLKGFDRFVAAMRDWLRMTAKRLRAGGFGLLADAIEPKTWTDADVAAFVLKAEQVSGKGGTGGAFSRPQGEAPTFYSALERAVTASPMKSAPVDGWRQFFKSQVAKGAVKADELEWTGVSEWLDLQQGKVSREAVLDYLAANGVQVTETVLGATEDAAAALTRALEGTGYTAEADNISDDEVFIIDPDGDMVEFGDLPPNVMAIVDQQSGKVQGATKYGQYTIPGGTNYREVLLTLPEKPGERGPKGWGSTAGATADTTNYRSGHWDQANILAHIRLNDRTDADGKRVLFVEEIQSDWAQEGKKKGFKDDARRAVVRAELEALRAKYGGDIRKAGGVDAARHAELLPEFDRLGGALPAAPFVGKTDAWVALAIKRVIGIAAREGYDRVAFVNGQQSAERYDLSKHVDQLTYGDDGVLRAFQGRKNVMSEKVAPEKIEDYIGKEVAKRLLDAPMEDGRRVLMGESLRIGGEGMQAFYDKIVPAVAKDVLRKVGGGQMGAVQIGAQREISTNVDDGAGGVIKRRESIGTTLTQPGFDITPTMREKAAAGLPLFSRRPDTMAPAVTVDRDADTGAPVYATDDITIGFPQKTERFEYLGGQNLINYSIGPADGFDSYGMVELEIGPDGVPIGLADIEIKPEYRGRDIGAKVVEAILAAHPGLDLDISNIVEGARGFWSRLGIPEQNRASGEAYDGTLNWQTFSQAQNARRADRAGARGRAAGEGRNAGAEGGAPGAGGQAPGQAQGDVARFSRATGMAEPWADKALSAADTVAGLISKPESIVGQTKREYTPEQSAAMKQVGFQVEPQKPSERIKALMQDAGKKIAQGVFDQFAPVKELSEKAYMLLRLSKGASGAFEALLKGGKLKITDGVYDFDEKNRGGVIKQLLTPLQGEHHDFLRWVAANRAERLVGEGKENLFTPESIAALKSLSDGVTSFDYTIQTGDGKGTVTRDRTLIYADAQRIFNGFQRNVMDMAEQSGLIDGEMRQMWEHEFYVPFYRVEDDGSVAGANIKNGVIRQQAFKALTGRSNKLNADLLDNTLMNWAHLLDAAAKNRAAKASIEAAENAKVALPIEGNMGKGSVWFMENGQKRWSFVDDPYLMTAISALQYGGLKGPAMQALSSLKHMLTIGVTASPFFKVRNLIRDSVQVIASSPIGVNPVANVVQGWKNTSPESDQYFRLLAGGGTIHFGTMMEGSEAKRVQALVESGVDASNILDSDKKVKAFYRKFIEPGITAYNELGNRGEAVNRAALYSQLIDQGVSHAEASLLARDLMDFSMGGSFASIRFLTQVVPFFNARLQGLYKLGRAAKEDPKRFSQVLGTVALISLGLLAAYGDDDDWKKREEWDRNNYWWFKFGGTAIRIPKPFEIGAIATLAERSAEYLMDDEMNGKRFRAQLLALLGDNLSMNPIPQAVKPMLDVYANKDSFSGRPIETMGMGRLKPEYRVRGDTSMAARGISSAANAATGLVGKEALSPVQIDHLIRGYFGWLGMFVVSASDIVARPATGQTDRPAPDYWKRATGGMVADLSDAPSRYVSQVYEQAKEIEQAYGTWRDLQKQGRREEADEFRRENTAAIMGYKTVERAKARMAHLNAEIRRIEKSEMGADEKRDAMRPIRTEQDALARRVPVLN